MSQDSQERTIDRWAKRIEMAANIGILVLVLVSVGLFVMPFLLRGQKPGEYRLPVGERLDLRGTHALGDKQTVLLILSTDCRFCTQSMAFYRRLSSERRHRDFVLVAALPETPAEAATYLRSNGLIVDGVVRATPSDFHAKGTPTLVLLDENRKVVDSWMGQLPSEDEPTVFERLKTGGSRDPSAGSSACKSGDCPP